MNKLFHDSTCAEMTCAYPSFPSIFQTIENDLGIHARFLFIQQPHIQLSALSWYQNCLSESLRVPTYETHISSIDDYPAFGCLWILPSPAFHTQNRRAPSIKQSTITDPQAKPRISVSDPTDKDCMVRMRKGWVHDMNAPGDNLGMCDDLRATPRDLSGAALSELT